MLLLVLGAEAFGPDARAVDIIPIWDSSILNNPNASDIQTTILAAIFEYKYLINDPLTVQITFYSMGHGLGESLPGSDSYSYLDFVNALAPHAQSQAAMSALASLPRQDHNPVNNSTEIWLSSAHARFLGLHTNAAPDDLRIGLYTDICRLAPNWHWCCLTCCGYAGYRYSLYAVICHEIDEVLGFSSILDNLNNGDPAPTWAIGVEDLWRYDLNGNRSLTTDPKAQAFFKIPGYLLGLPIARFNQTQGGDFHDWYSPGDQTPQVQDAITQQGEDPRLGPAEFAVFQAIGYSVMPPVIWLDFSGSGSRGSYFDPYTKFTDAVGAVDNGGTIIVKATTWHTSRVSSPTPCKLTSFGGTTRITQ